MRRTKSQLVDEVSELRRRVEELVANDNRYRSLIEDQPDFISRYMPDGTLTFVNGAYARQHGFSPDGMIGRNIFEFVPPEEIDRVRSYLEDPSIGVDKVEAILDAAHALSMQCRRNLAIKKLSLKEQRERMIEAARPAVDPFEDLHQQEEYKAPDLNKIPASPEADLLLFIRDYNRKLSDWERDLLTIVHEALEYFLPQMETKIMNEGWASFWHREIMHSLDLPQELHLEFLVRHNQVVRPFPKGLNPYYLGLKVWDDIKRRHDDPTPEEIEKYGKPTETGMEAIFAVREVDRDASFLRRFLTEELMREMDMFEYEPRGEDLVISKVSDKDGWRKVKETLIQSVFLTGSRFLRISRW
mgnify:CR=1 FL=1